MNGTTVDTNSSWIAKKVSIFHSLRVASKVTVNDDVDSINSKLHSILEDGYKYIFITGGLGPTHDDITKKALSIYFNSNLIIEQNHLKLLKKIFDKKNIKKIQHLKSQAEILDVSLAIPNDIGTALGMYIEKNDTKIFVLPGVPNEMKTMINSSVIPLYIAPYFKQTLNNITILTTGAYESKLYDLLSRDISKNQEEFTLSFLPNYHGVKIKIIKKNDKINDNKFNAFKNDIINKIDKYVYGYNDDKIEKTVADSLIKNKITVSVAESCTGGLLSKRLTDYPNSTVFFKGSLIAYSNDVKIDLLNIPQELISKYGEVSEEVAVKMSCGIKNKFKTDVGISITGISGPSGGSKEKAVGTVCISIAFNEEVIVKTFNIVVPNRKIHRSVSVYTALNMLRLLLNKKSICIK